MREIKFRAWHIEQKKMYSPEEMGQDQLTLMPDGRGFANISGDFTFLSQIDNGRKMLPLQYTGLKDKNGKEIYEGDIIKFPYYRKDQIQPVEWGTDGWWAKSKGWFKELYWVADKCQVIGNIYKNPELLKEISNG